MSARLLELAKPKIEQKKNSIANILQNNKYK